VIPVAFYAPLKPPDDPRPSGDSTMARLFLSALTQAGLAPRVASTLRSWDGVGDRGHQEKIRKASIAEAERLIDRWRFSDARPRLWFTYHVYHKAPDWIGPQVADAFHIPYVIAEASHAPRRAAGAWAFGHRGAEAAIERADLILVMTEPDREMLARMKEPARLVDCPPFIDLAEWAASAFPPRRPGPAAQLLTVAMMRHGDKLASYRILADALRILRDRSWTLDIVGDGEARSEVERLFSGFDGRIRCLGQIDDRTHLSTLYRKADIFVWPAVNEAYGMVLLEAQAFGCPIVAGAYAGVRSVVRDEATGVLAAPGDAKSLADAIDRLLQDWPQRERLGQAAERFVRRERGLGRAAEQLRRVLTPLLADATAP
jgi:glycosyltransferase involved in cell wall biosynthesis